MPRFSHKERMLIQEQLLTEGKAQFSTNGLFKVSVMDLCRSAGISKGSFYAFYESKEHLFMAVNYGEQKAMYDEIESLLPTLKEKQADKIALFAFSQILQSFIHNPFLSTIDIETLNHLKRKLGEDTFNALNYDDTRLLRILKSQYVSFSLDDDIMVKALQALLAAALSLKEDIQYDDIMTLLLEGLIHQTIC